MLITKAEMSRIAGVSTSAMSKACRTGSLKSAVCDGKVDTKSEAIRLYLRKKNIDPDKALPDDKDKIIDLAEVYTGNKDNVSGFSLPGNVDPKKFENMTLPMLCDIFGTDERFKNWVEARKKLTEIDKNEIANAKASGLLVSKALIKMGILDPIDSVFATLLTDTSKTIALRAEAMVKAGSDIEDVKKLVVDQISSVIRPAKAKVKRIFKDA